MFYVAAIFTLEIYHICSCMRATLSFITFSRPIESNSENQKILPQIKLPIDTDCCFALKLQAY